jgi:hypothetical protein
MVPDINENLNQLALQPVMEMLQQIRNDINQIRNDINQIRNDTNRMNSKNYNSTAHADTHDLNPHLNDNNDAIPNNFPRNMNRLVNLTVGRLITMEAYYNLPTIANMSLSDRKDRMRRLFGVGLMTSVSTVLFVNFKVVM